MTQPTQQNTAGTVLLPIRESIVKTVQWGARTIQGACRGFLNYITRIYEAVRPFFSRAGSTLVNACKTSATYVNTHRSAFAIAILVIAFGCLALDAISPSSNSEEAEPPKEVNVKTS